jgi:hypothetical protein
LLGKGKLNAAGKRFDLGSVHLIFLPEFGVFREEEKRAS